jgi:RNA ligase
MLNLPLLQQHLADRLITARKHPSADLWIYNYSPVVQYEKRWDAVTMQCRGLILDAEYQIVARPFQKFFNLDELPAEAIPDEPFAVYEKLDGSLGILYWLNNEPFIATRGSFMSDQAIRATDILHSRYAHTFGKLHRDRTYLFEIIYPQNKIVVNYGDREDLVLLAIINNQTGQDCLLDHEADNLGFPVVKRFTGFSALEKLKAEADNNTDDNAEGYVLRFESGLRVKVKLAEYVRLHRIITGVSNIAIWEYLSEGRDFGEVLDRVPDELYDWVRGVQNDLLARYAAIETEAKAAFAGFDFTAEHSRKDVALYFQTQRHPAILFKMLDGGSYKSIIWKHIRPVFSKSFWTEVA